MATDFIGFAYAVVIIAGGVMGLLTKGIHYLFINIIKNVSYSTYLKQKLRLYFIPKI